MISSKPKNIFNHLEDIIQRKDKNYFDNLTDKEKKDYSIYMMQRFMSMKYEYVSFISYIDKFTNILSKKNYHRLLCALIPKKGSFYIDYIKKDKKEKEGKNIDWFYDMIKEYYQVSIRWAIEYYKLMNSEDKEYLLDYFGSDKKKRKMIL